MSLTPGKVKKKVKIKFCCILGTPMAIKPSSFFLWHSEALKINRAFTNHPQAWEGNVPELFSARHVYPDVSVLHVLKVCKDCSLRGKRLIMTMFVFFKQCIDEIPDLRQMIKFMMRQILEVFTQVLKNYRQFNAVQDCVFCEFTKSTFVCIFSVLQLLDLWEIYPAGLNQVVMLDNIYARVTYLPQAKGFLA